MTTYLMPRNRSPQTSHGGQTYPEKETVNAVVSKGQLSLSLSLRAGTYLRVVGTELINCTELDQLLVDAERRKG